MSASRRALRAPLSVALSAALVTSGLGLAASAPAAAQSSPTFTDLSSTIHAEAIGLIAEAGITTGYPDGTFRPRDDVRRDQMATFLSNGLGYDGIAPSFPDVPADSPHYLAIGALDAAGVSRGFSDGTYRPRNLVTRGQMASFLALALDLEPGSGSFSDVPSDYVHADAIAALSSSEITSGFPDGTFRPNNPVKRDQMAAFLVNGLGLPDVEECPGSAPQTTESPATTASATAGEVEADVETGAGSADLEELRSGDVAEAASEDAGTLDDGASAMVATESFGPAVPGIAFPLTSVLRTTSGTLEAHTQDLPSSRGVRIAAAGDDVTATTTIPAGRRTWATTQVGDQAYVGQWGTGTDANVYRYSTTANGDRRAQAVATVPSGNEFWTLAADGQGRLWAGTRAHNSGDVRDQLGLGNGLRDGRHVVHRVDTRQNHRVVPVLICLPNPATNDGGTRPDIKQIATAGSTVYLATGQQNRGARVYAVEPGTDTDIPASRVRDLTPQNVRAATGVFAMTAVGNWLVLGTQAGSGDSARLVVIDRRTEQVRANVLLTGQSRVDAVDVSGNRIVAAAFDGSIYELTASATGPIQQNATRHDPPVAGQFHRFVEVAAGGAIRGVTQQGIVWTRRSATDIDRFNLVDDDDTPVAPGLPHSLHVGATDTWVGANSVVTRRGLDDLEEPHTVAIQGEAKTITSDPAGNAYVASYPNATLWRIGAGEDEAEVVRPWTAQFRRPADVDHDAVNDQVFVVARDDNDPRSETRTAPQANFQYRPSRLFRMETTPGQTGQQAGWALTRANGQPVEASAVLVDPSRNAVFVGDTFGGVQRIQARGTGVGERQWYRAADTQFRDRPVVDLELVGDDLVVTTSGSLRAREGSPSTYDPRTVITVLDPEAPGTVRSTHPVATTGGTPFAIPDAVTSGTVTAMPSRTVVRFFDRATGTYSQQTHPRNDSFGGPYASLDREGCFLYRFENEPSDLVRDPFARGECAPE